MLRLSHWRITQIQDGICIAHGNITGHYRLEDGAYIHTSAIQKLWRLEDEDGFVMETMFGNVYRILTSEADLDYCSVTAVALQSLGLAQLTEEEKGEIIRMYEETKGALREKNRAALEGAREWAGEHLEPGGLYLIIDHGETKKALFKTEEGDLMEIEQTYHVGTLQDSILIMDHENHIVDFRYFPYAIDLIRLYHWGDNIENVYIYNLEQHDLTVKGWHEERFICRAGEVAKLNKSEVKGDTGVTKSDDLMIV